MKKARFFEQGGGGVFVSITTNTTREVRSSTHNTCVLVGDWREAIAKARKFIEEKQLSSRIELVEIFIKPRLCSQCLEHATQPLMFDEAKHITECLCWIEGTPCGVHQKS